MKKEKNKDFKIIKKGLIAFMIILLSWIHIKDLSIKWYSYYKYKNEITKNYEEIVKVNEEKKNRNGVEKKTVEAFDILTDTFRFKNFVTQKSTKGNCEGYTMYEIQHFNNHTTENLSSYRLSADDIKKLYWDGTAVADLSDIEQIDYKKTVKEALGMCNNEKQENIEVRYNDNTELNDKKIDEIIKEISELQSNNYNDPVYSQYSSQMFYSSNPIELSNSEKSNNKSANPEIIKNFIDNDKLVMVGIGNEKLGGHALLAYGYEVIDKNNVKIYVADSNLPIKEGKEEEYIDSMYILFTKEIVDGTWSFIYRPTIEGKIIYRYYNSFVPGTTFIVCIL